MKTTLTGDGRIDIPSEIRQADHLAVGDAFNLERLTQGQYLLTRLPSPSLQFTVVTAADGLPLIRGAGGVITAQQVADLESQIFSATPTS